MTHQKLQRIPITAGLLALAMCWGAGGAATAAIILADPADGRIDSWNGGTPYVNNTTGASVFIGQLSTGNPGDSGYSCYVMPFKLPNAGAVANPFTDASFHGFSDGDAWYTYRSLVLYGIAARSTPDLLATDFHTGGGTDPNATYLGWYRWVGDVAPAAGTETVVTGSNLLNFLNAQYDSGNGAGKYVFLRLEMDGDNQWWHGFNERTADHPDPATRPYLDLTFAAVPEPGSLAILAIGAGLISLRRRLVA